MDSNPFSGGIMGPDKYGNIILVQPMGRARPKTMMRLGRVSDLYKAAVLEAEACMYFLRYFIFIIHLTFVKLSFR